MQIELPIVWGVIILYFIIVIAIGIFSRRSIVTAEDYHIAGGKVKAFLNGTAQVAGYLSPASLLGFPAYVFLLGLPIHWGLVGIAGVMPLTIPLVAGQLRKAKPVSTTDYFAWRYETNVYGRIILTIAYIWAGMLYIILCMVGMGLAFVATLRVHYVTALFVAMIVMIIYLWLGGMVAHTYATAFQTFVMVFAALAVLLGMWAVAGGPGPLYATAEKIHYGTFLSPSYNTNYGKVLLRGNFDPDWLFTTGYISAFCWASVWALGALCQPFSVFRVFTAAGPKAARWTFVWATIWTAVFYTILILIGAGARAFIEVFMGHPYLTEGISIKPDNPTLGILIYYYKTFGLGSLVDYTTLCVTEAFKNPWLLGFLVAGVFAIGMGTVASWALLTATVLARDWPHYILKKPLPPKKEVMWTRIIMTILIVIGTLIAIKPAAMILDLSGAAFLVILTLLAPPIITGIWWKRGGPTAFKIYTTVMLVLTIFSWMFSYLVWKAPHAFFLFPKLGTPNQIYWLYIGFVIWIILCLVTKPSSPETIKKYCEDLHKP
ncbi:hypothetical protein CW703_04660 [Candidatus Bathyarchaeota archaeon]|nr:MAG: hypothetical protein CW703_04660 [Candidatus Bathyarchaeota archaeon]